MENKPDKPPLPPLKTDPRYGCFPWWPEDGDGWLHPEDAALARSVIPSPRIWRRDGDLVIGDDGFATLTYGDMTLRVRPRLWLQTPAPAFVIGDLVEVLPRGMQNDPVTGRVREVHWDDPARTIRYQLDVADRTVETTYTADDLKPVEPTRVDPRVRIEPVASAGEVDDLVEGLAPDEHRSPWG